MTVIILSAIQYTLIFILGYQAARIVRKRQDLEFLDELYSLILKKADESLNKKLELNETNDNIGDKVNNV